MKCTDCTAAPYSLPVLHPLHINGRLLIRREGVIVCITGEGGVSGKGEIAPLPGLHRESLSDAIESIDMLFSSVNGRVLPADEEEVGRFIRSMSNGPMMPSVQTGLEMALYELLWAQSASASATSIRLNALITEDAQDPVRQAALLADEGYTSLKLKVGRRSPEDDIRLVCGVRAAIDNRATLRLDANRTWSRDQAISFGKAVGPEGIEYIEEPIAGGHGVTEFFKATGISVGLDETLASADFTESSQHTGIGAFVLKPSVLGGITRTVDRIRLAQHHDITAVLSSSFESHVGLAFYARLAARYGLTGHAHGLDTWRWLHDQPDAVFPVDRGNVFIRA